MQKDWNPSSVKYTSDGILHPIYLSFNNNIFPFFKQQTNKSPEQLWCPGKIEKLARANITLRGLSCFQVFWLQHAFLDEGYMIFAWPGQWKRVYERGNNHHGKFKSSSVANICTLLGLHVSKSQAKQKGKSIWRHSKSKLTLFIIHAMSLFLSPPPPLFLSRERVWRRCAAWAPLFKPHWAFCRHRRMC